MVDQNNFNLSSLQKMVTDILTEAKEKFPRNSEHQLKWATAKAMRQLALQTAHFLRTTKNDVGETIFPNIFPMEGCPMTTASDAQQCAQSLYHGCSLLNDVFIEYENLIAQEYDEEQHIFNVVKYLPETGYWVGCSTFPTREKAQKYIQDMEQKFPENKYRIDKWRV